MKNVFLKILMTIGFVSLFIACDEDFGSLGADIVGAVNFETELAQDFEIVAYSRNFENSVQSNGIPVGVLGHYNDPVYGSNTASVVSQVTISRTNPSFGESPVLESVIFTLPYFATAGEVNTEGETTYTLDSIFNNSGPMRLSAYKSNYFLNALDPESGFQEPQVYYSNEIDNLPGIEGELLFQLENFQPSSDEIVIPDPTEEDPNNVERLSPRLRLDLKLPEDDEETAARPWLDNVTFDWEEFIINQEGSDVFVNANSFNDYFRGVYLKAESLDGTGSFFIFDLSSTQFEINYTFDGNDDSTIPGENQEEGQGSLVINFSGVQAINYDNNFSTSPIGDPAFNITQDRVNGEEQLFLKGGDGSIAIIELFGIDDDNENGIPDEDEGLTEDVDENKIPEQLESLRECGIIINEANLTFFVDQDALGAEGTGEREPERLFLYDYDNNRILLDSSLDLSAGTQGPVTQRTNHLGRLVRTVTGDLTSPGLSYRMRVTQHINNIIKNDSTNVRLALAVSQNVTLNNTSIIEPETDTESERRIPIGSVISPEGTILLGNQSIDEAKKLRLRLYYTTTEDIDPDSPCAIALGL